MLTVHPLIPTARRARFRDSPEALKSRTRQKYTFWFTVFWPMQDRVQPGRAQEPNQALRAESAGFEEREWRTATRKRDQGAITQYFLGAEWAERNRRLEKLQKEEGSDCLSWVRTQRHTDNPSKRHKPGPAKRRPSIGQTPRASGQHLETRPRPSKDYNPFLPKLASGPDAESALLVGHIDHLHLRNRVLTGDPRLRLTALGLVDELLEHVSVRHPEGLARQAGELATSLLEGVGLVRLLLLPSLDHLAIGADDVLVLDVDAVPNEAEEDAVQRQLARHRLLLLRGKGSVKHDDFLVGHGYRRRVPDGAAAQRTLSHADAAVGEAEFSFEVDVAVFVRLFREGVRLAAYALDRLGVEE